MQIEKAYYWPLWLAKSLRQDNANRKNYVFGKANMHLWRALNIYDDFLDGEGDPENLQAANHDFRSFLKIIYTSNLPSFFLTWAEQALTDLEKSNQEEVTTKKLSIQNGYLKIPRNLPKFENLKLLSRKSLPLSIAPIAEIMNGDCIKNKKELKRFVTFFEYALAAKQLSDDACDWLEDSKNGQITAVNILLLNEAKRKKIKLDLEGDAQTAHVLFITAVAEKTCLNILTLCSQAKKSAKKINIQENAKIIEELIKPLEKAAKKALNFKRML